MLSDKMKKRNFEFDFFVLSLNKQRFFTHVFFFLTRANEMFGKTNMTTAT